MILELTDEEILDFLMTSEFEDNYKPEELKYLLHKFRYFYRVMNGKYDQVKLQSETEVKKLTDIGESKKLRIENMMVEIANLQNTISSLKSRKLSFKERISGKII
jgi:hypothetical protein